MAQEVNSAQQSQAFAGAELVGTAGVFYTNPQETRFEIALTTAEAYQEAGLPYVVIDASPLASESNTWVASALRQRGATVLRAGKHGIATQRQQGVAYAMANGAEKILGQEPEKIGIPRFAPEIARALDTYDVLVIGRTDKSEESLPPVQRRTERLAGWILEQTLDMPHDAFCGPQAFSIAGARQLANYPSREEGMNSLIYLCHTPLAARAAGLAVIGADIELMYPAAMVAEETNNKIIDAKRYAQFQLQLDYLMRRPDIKQNAKPIAAKVLAGFSEMSEKPTNEEFEEYLTDLESTFKGSGYLTPSEAR
jgi:hypothetical protein